MPYIFIFSLSGSYDMNALILRWHDQCVTFLESVELPEHFLDKDDVICNSFNLTYETSGKSNKNLSVQNSLVNKLSFFSFCLPWKNTFFGCIWCTNRSFKGLWSLQGFSQILSEMGEALKIPKGRGAEILKCQEWNCKLRKIVKGHVPNDCFLKQSIYILLLHKFNMMK